MLALSIIVFNLHYKLRLHEKICTYPSIIYNFKNSVTYTKIIKNYIGGSCCFNCPTDGTGYKGAIRQDSIARKIYIIQPNNTTEDVLYDFSQNVGDTLNSILIFCGPEIITAVNSVIIGTTYHRRLITSSNCNWFTIEIIEGIGSNKGLLELFVGFEYGGSLICLSHNGQTIYPDTTTYCEVTVGITEHIEKIHTSVYTNPLKDKFEVSLSQRISDIKFKLYDTFGRNVMSNEFSNVNSFTIKRENISSGIYFYQLISENRIISTGKLIAE